MGNAAVTLSVEQHPRCTIRRYCHSIRHRPSSRRHMRGSVHLDYFPDAGESGSPLLPDYKDLSGHPVPPGGADLHHPLLCINVRDHANSFEWIAFIIILVRSPDSAPDVLPLGIFDAEISG